jgi:hypothetical protein
MTTKKSNWQKGQSGNPAGKPRGARNKATMMVLGLMEQGAEEITQAVIDAARGGDLSAARMVLERLAPPMRERPISIDLPDTSTTDGIDRAQQAIIEAVGTGALLPGEGNVLAGLVEARRKALETIGLEQRIAMLEEQYGQKGRSEQS